VPFASYPTKKATKEVGLIQWQILELLDIPDYSKKKSVPLLLIKYFLIMKLNLERHDYL